MDLGQRLSNFFQNRVAQPVQQEVQRLPQQVAGFGQNLMRSVAQPVRQGLANVGQNAINFENQHPLIGQFQSGQRATVTPLIQNFMPNFDQVNKQFQQPNTQGMLGNVANFVGQQAPFVPLMAATAGLANPVTSKLASLVPNGTRLGTSMLSGAAKGAINLSPFAALSGLDYAPTMQGRVQNVVNAVPGTLAFGGGVGAVGGAGKFAVNSVMQKLSGVLQENHNMNPQQAEKVAMQFVKDELGRFTGQRVPVTPPVLQNAKPFNIPNMMKSDMALAPEVAAKPMYSAARGKLYNNKSVRMDTHEPTYYGDLRQALGVPRDFNPQGGFIKPDEFLPKGKTAQEPPIPQTDRGLVKSVMESPNLALPTKGQTTGMYTPKPNSQLMGEAQALLSEGASLDLKHVEHADQKVAATIQEAINLDKQGQHDAAAHLFNNLSEHGTELGRGVQAFSLLDKMSPEAISMSAAGKIKAYNRTAGKKIPELNGDQQKLISDHVSRIQSLKPGRDKNIAIHELNNTINDFIPSTIVDKGITVWKAGLLTSLRTSGRNILGNTIHAAAETVKDIPASIMDRIMSLRTGKRSLTFNTQGAASGAGKGLVAAKDMLTKGYDPEESLTKFDQKRITWGKNPLEQALKFGTDVVFRSLGAQDKPFLHSAISRSLHDQAKAAAINAGKSGDSKFIQELVSNPTPDMAKIAMKDAETLTFKNKNVMSDIINSAKRAAQNPKYGKGAELGKVVTEGVAPFTGVPSSIGGQLVAYSPIGLAKGIAKAGTVLAKNVPDLQRQAAQEVGRGVIGTGLIGVGAYLSSKGLMTGQPKDANQQAQWQLENKPANSVFIDGKWRAIGSIGPENLVILAGAKAQEELSKPDGSLGTYSANLGKDFLGQTFLQGVQQPLAAISDPARYGQSYLGNQAASAVPNIVKDAAKSQDPSVRENNNIGDYITNSIPGLRNQNVVKRDNLGNVIPQEPTGAGAFFDLFNSKTPVSNPVVDELGRLDTSGNNAVPNKLGKSQTINGEKVKLTPQQLNTLESQVGPQATDSIKQLMQTPDYQALSDEEKAKAIDSIVTQVRKQVRGNINLSNGTTNPLPNNGQQYTLISDTGTVKRIDLSKGITQPQLTGLVELDKKINAKYNSELAARQNDILSLYQAGKIDAKLAESKIEDLKSQHTATGKGRKASIKKNFLSAVPKFKPISFSKSKMTSVKTPRGKSVKRFSLSKLSFKPTTKSKKIV